MLASWKRLRTCLVISFQKTNNRSAFSSFWIDINMAYQAELSEEFEETSEVYAKNRKTRENAPKQGQTMRWNN